MRHLIRFQRRRRWSWYPCNRLTEECVCVCVSAKRSVNTVAVTVGVVLFLLSLHLCLRVISKCLRLLSFLRSPPWKCHWNWSTTFWERERERLQAFPQFFRDSKCMFDGQFNWRRSGGWRGEKLTFISLLQIIFLQILNWVKNFYISDSDRATVFSCE